MNGLPESKKGVKTSTVALHTVRTKDGCWKAIRMGRTLAIKLFCMECMGWEVNPDDCTSPSCPLYPFRGYTQASLRGDKATAKTGGDR